MRTFNGTAIDVSLGQERSDALNALCRQEGVTPFMALLASLGTVLDHHGRQEEVVIGSPIAYRFLPELEPLIGLFVNGLALRVDLRGNPGLCPPGGALRVLFETATAERLRADLLRLLDAALADRA